MKLLTQGKHFNGGILRQHPRLLQDIVLNLLLVPTILEHTRQALHTTHTATNARAHFGRVHVLVQLVGVRDTGHVEGLRCTDKSPESGAVGLSDDVGGNTESTRIPTSRDLAGNGAAERERLRDEDPRALLELDEPLITFSCPDIALVTVLVLELLGVRLRSFERFKVVEELDLLVEYLLLGVVTTEEIGLFIIPSVARLAGL